VSVPESVAVEGDSAVGAADPQSCRVFPRNDFERRIFEIWSQVFESSSFGVTDAFYDLGGDSLKAVTMLTWVDSVFDVKLPPVQMLYTPTIEALSNFLRGGKVVTELADAVIELRAGAALHPLFCFPGVGGDLTCFCDFASLFADGRGIHGVLYRALDRAPTPASMANLAASCLIAIKAVQPQGPYYLGGYSFGASVAYEVGQQLHAAGEEVALLALWEPDLDPNQFRMALTRILLNTRGIASWPWRSKFAFVVGKLTDWLRFLTTGALVEPDISARDIDRKLMKRLATFQSNAMALHQRYKHLPYNGPILVVCAADGQPKRDLSFWLRMARGGLNAVSVPGDHWTMFFAPNVSYVVEAMQEHLNARTADSGPPAT